MPASASPRWAWLAALTVAYVLAGKLGLLFASVHASATAVWPPTGIAIAALLILGVRMWPAVAAGAFLVNVTTAGSVATSLGIALGNTLEAVVGVWLVGRLAHGRGAFERPRGIFAFAAAVVPGAAIAATVAVASLVLGGFAPRADAAAIWITWALGDISGALIVAPLLILWTADPRSLALRRQPIEALALLLGVVGIALIVFGGLAPAAWRQYPMAFLAIPPLLWAAVRFGRREASIAVVVLMAIAVGGTMRGFGSFAALPPTHSLLVLQSFVATMAVMTLVVAALVRSREREGSLLQAIIDRIPVMITMYEASTQVLRLNREFERLTGWSTETARGVDLMARCYPDPAYRTEVRAFMDSGREGWRDIAMTTRDGRLLHTSWSNIRLPDDTRIGIGLDATERRRTEDERERARADAEEASRIKDEFFAMLGHELRNPLGAITTALHVIDTGAPGDERSAQARDIITRQVRHLVRLVDDLLDVTRLATGKITLARRPVDLAVVARRVVGALAATTPALRLGSETDGSVWIEADETRLEQILNNLLGNAVKFTAAGGRVTVGVAVRDGLAVLSVEDTGAGIAADLLPRIFDLFVQGQSGLHRPAPGLGIGLTLVKRLVDLHGGRIEAASEGPGRGSVFTVRFPLHPAPREATHAVSRSAGARVRRRVLIVEDNDDARGMLRHLLERTGHEVYEAADGLIGLERAIALRPDAAVIDIGLPGLDGYEVARRVRAAGAADVLLVAVTGYGQAGDRQRSSEAGFNAHLTKPVDPPALESLLENLPLDPRRTGR
ncbi:MAG TPA: MASE1 domain-containing protein [Candidatus Limnocylindria bacterium]|nr:MASE1 domain-containing protein [Candidatus Limnocylindria bacterium]